METNSYIVYKKCKGTKIAFITDIVFNNHL